jgi:hypothetical protein
MRSLADRGILGPEVSSPPAIGEAEALEGEDEDEEGEDDEEAEGDR